jgi:hypothetical protein
VWRPVAIGLLAANLLFLAWTLWIAAPADPAARPLVGAAAPAPVPAPPMPPAAVASPPPRCVSLGPFGDAAVATTVEQRLLAAGLLPRSREERQQQRDGWWVWVASSDAAQQRQVLARIRRAGIQDAYALPDDPQFRISLGIYSDRGRAAQRAASLRPLDVTPRVEEHVQERKVQWLDVPEAGDRLSASRLESFGIADSEVGAFDCP